MTETKTNLQQAVEEILDIVSSRESTQDWVKGKQITYDVRWGHDTDCGNADS